MFAWLRRAYLKFWDREREKAQSDAQVLRSAQEQIGGLPTPPTGACAYRLPFGTFCGRPLFEEVHLCFWHCRNPEKYSPEKIEKYFGSQITFKAAIEKEVKSGASLYGA